MDFSKLSNEDLLALKAGDYSKVSNEGLLTLKQQPQKVVPYTEELGKELWQKMEKSGEFKPLEPVAGPITEALTLGIGGASVAPKVAGLAVKAGKGITKAGKVAFAPRLKTAAKALGQAEEEAGIAVEAINKALPRTREAMLNTLEGWKPLSKAPIEQIRNVGKEGLNIIRKQAGDLLDFLKVAKQGVTPKQLLTKREVAYLSEIKDKVTKALSAEAPKVGEKISKYAASAKRADILKKLGKVAGVSSATGLAGAAGYGGYKLMKGLLQ